MTLPGSLRVRVFVLVVAVAVAATGATAWLTLRGATQQLAESATLQRSIVNDLGGQLRAYATEHGTWEGVAYLVDRLHAETAGQRIQLTTAGGEVIVDTDHRAGRASRPRPPEPAALVDPLPSLDLTSVPQQGLVGVTLAEIQEHRRRTLFSACLTRIQLQARLQSGPPSRELTPVVPDRELVSGTPDREPTPADRRSCERFAADGSGAATTGWDRREADKCLEMDPADQRSCLEDTFRRRTGEIGPVPLLLFLGVGGTPPSRVPDLSNRRALAAAGLVAVLAVAVTILLTQRVLRPINRLIRASRRLGDGDLDERVPVSGRDELAELAAAFNRMADSLQRSKRQQRRMIGDIAHELRSPLANLRGYLEALKDGVVDPDPELFASLHEEAVLQQRLVDDLQELALAEAGALVHHRSQIDLAELLETCRTAHQAAAKAAGIDLRVEAGRPPPVDADSDRLRQAVGNLVANALLATPPGGSVTLRAPATGGEARIEVEDTGHGIAPDDLPHVFDRLWRADSARTRTTGGSGLGLAIARELVAAYGGTITATSTQGHGSVFTITLPLAASRSEPARSG